MKNSNASPADNPLNSQSLQYPKITLSDNPDITREEYQRALKIGEEIRQMLALQAELSEKGELKEGLDKTSDVWKSPNGAIAYGEVIKKDPLTPDYETVNHLLIHAFHFSGYRLSSILSDQPISNWNDSIAGLIPQKYRGGSTDWSVGAFLEIKDRLPPEFVCRPPVKLGWVGWQVDDIVINRDLMAYQERVALLFQCGVLEKLAQKGGALNILEIGGGYGGLASFLKKILPDANYYICDLPESLFYSAAYLSLTSGGDDIYLYRREDGAADGYLKDPRGGFVFVPHFLFDDLRDLKIDLAINTLSFAEMEPATVAKYAQNISFMLKDGCYLFEQNYDNSYYSSKFSNFCDPEKVIPATTNLKKKDIGYGRWGPARLWSPAGRFPESPVTLIDYQVQPRLIRKAYKGYNIVYYWNKYLGFVVELGVVDLTKTPQSTLYQYVDEKRCIMGDSLEDVIAQIDSQAAPAESAGDEPYKGYFILPIEQGYAAVEQSLVAKFPLEPAQFEAFIASGKLIMGPSVEALQEKIDYMTFSAAPQRVEANYGGYQIFFFQFDYYAILINQAPIRKLPRPLARPLFLAGSTLSEVKAQIDRAG
jgi:hypothetical protein